MWIRGEGRTGGERGEKRRWCKKRKGMVQEWKDEGWNEEKDERRKGIEYIAEYVND
jgi:hypothetical protein